MFNRLHLFGGARTRVITALALSAVLTLSAVTSATAADAAAPAAGHGIAAGSSSVVTETHISPGARVKAANLGDFRAGNIVSDEVFFNSGTMSEAQIQSFLEARVPACQSGYTCLKDWYDTSRTTSADAMCGAYSGGVRERASRIIFKVAQACGINPQVLLVTLQKEQGLVTHTWPSEWRYTAAMGQGCPDTAACDTRYYGFFNQVFGAAWQFKRYANPPGTSAYFTWYAPGKTWNILYNPNSGCGSSPVYVQNQATANLYYYTPYQPNAAALRAGYGTGDGCSAYGNRNFFNYFTDWFGSTTANDNPFGNVELVEPKPGVFEVIGWAADPNSAAATSVHVYVGSSGTAVGADLPRPDVGAAYPALGSAHGFSASVPATGSGQVDVCVYAMNIGAGSNALLGCWARQAKSGSPIGFLDTVVGSAGAVTVTGWAIDADSTAPIAVHVYVGSTGTAMTADAQRDDLARLYPEYGGNHGFAATIAAGSGTYEVCAYAINVGAGGNVALGCVPVEVPASGDAGTAPIGNLEAVTAGAGEATVSGWALDPDTSDPISIHIYVDDAGAAYIADDARPDVAVRGRGEDHGFSEAVAMASGSHRVCVYAINDGAGGNVQLGCRDVAIP